MTTWFVVALVYATGLAQQSQGLVTQSALPPPAPAASTARPEAKTQTDVAKPATAKKSEVETKAPVSPPVVQAESTKPEDNKPAEATPQAAPAEKKPAAGAHVAAFWFILPRN